MEFCVLKICNQTATFRNPDFQNYHKTLFLPPPTTLIGLAGAALGQSPKKSQEFFEQDNFQFGVYGSSIGLAKDLWKFRKKKSNNFETDIITKEILFFNEFYIVYASFNNKLIDDLKKAFKYPTYALTLGNSDSLAKIKILSNYNPDKSNIIENTIIEDDVINKVINNPDKSLNFSIYTTSDPITYDLPIQFNYASDYGFRSIKKRKQFSFIGSRMELNYSMEGLFVENKFIPFFKIN